VNKSRPRMLIIIGTAAAAAGVSFLTLSSTGVAGASPDISGKSFSEAQAALQQLGYTAVAAVAMGDKTARSDCKVVCQQDVAGGIPGWSTANTSSLGAFVGW